MKKLKKSKKKETVSRDIKKIGFGIVPEIIKGKKTNEKELMLLGKQIMQSDNGYNYILEKYGKDKKVICDDWIWKNPDLTIFSFVPISSILTDNYIISYLESFNFNDIPQTLIIHKTYEEFANKLKELCHKQLTVILHNYEENIDLWALTNDNEIFISVGA